MRRLQAKADKKALREVRYLIFKNICYTVFVRQQEEAMREDRKRREAEREEKRKLQEEKQKKQEELEVCTSKNSYKRTFDDIHLCYRQKRLNDRRKNKNKENLKNT